MRGVVGLMKRQIAFAGGETSSLDDPETWCADGVCPFTDIPCHVGGAIDGGVLGKRARRGCQLIGGMGLSVFKSISVLRVKNVSPWVEPSIHATCSLFPFIGGGEAARAFALLA